MLERKNNWLSVLLFVCCSVLCLLVVALLSESESNKQELRRKDHEIIKLEDKNKEYQDLFNNRYGVKFPCFLPDKSGKGGTCKTQ